MRRGVEVLLVSLALLSCEGPLSILEPEPEPDANVDAGVAERVVRVAARPATAPSGTRGGPTQPRPEPVVAPPVPPPPPPDPEAELRAQREAERLAFEHEWPLHGVCYHYLAHVRARPDASSPIIGYMRRGAQFRAKEGVRGAGCARGWNEIVGGGFVCRGEGYQLGETPQTFEGSPVAPALDSALPYPYAYVGRADAPQYWRIPTETELAESQDVMERLRDARERATAAATASGDEGEGGPDPGLEAPPQLQSAELSVPTTLPTYFRMRMERGFYVSVDREEMDGETRYYRTIRGAYVPADAMTVATPPSMRGVVLGGAWRPPLGFVYRRGSQAFSRDPVTGALGAATNLDYHAPLLLQDDTIERRGHRHRITRQGAVIRETNLRIIEPIDRPRAIPATDKWIHVDLSSQTLVAYEGDRPVFATLVSSGREGFETPTGTFRIQSKHVSATMDDTASATEAYSIEDVPWTMYFEGSFALHAALWHDQFGRQRSHGCVNLAPADARWLFQWTTPVLPPGWHGVVSTSRRQGTWVHITP
ncbi:MAG: L,D-transpeptidase [Sandaracinus sp.]